MNNLSNKLRSQGRPPASAGEDRRERILDSALTLFAAQGIAGSPLAQIAGAAGVTPAMIHYYFNNRDGLLDCLVSERLASVVDYVWGDLPDGASADPRRLVTAFVDRLLESIEKMPQLPRLWSREILNEGGLLRERIFSLFPLERLGKLLRVLTEAQQQGQLNAGVAPGLVLTSIMAVVMLPLAAQSILSRISPLPAFDREELRQHALALLLDGLCPEGLQGEKK